MATYHSSAFVKQSEAELIRHYLDDEPETEADALINDELRYLIPYPNGYEIEISCHGIGCFCEGMTNTASVEVCLFDASGCEEEHAAAEWSSEFFSDWTFQDSDGNEYVARIIVSRED